MAKKPKEKEISAPTVSPQAGLQMLKQVIAQGDELRSRRPVTSDDSAAWRDTAIGTLERAFGRGSHEVEAFSTTGVYGSFDMYASPSEQENERFEIFGSRLAKLRGFLQLLEADAKHGAGVESSVSGEPVDDLATHLTFLQEGNAALAELVSRDLLELERARQAKCHKSCMSLAGSILEGILLFVLDQRRDLMQSVFKKRKFPDEASLVDLIRIASESPFFTDGSKFLSPTSAALAQGLTEHRDLHPNAELTSRIQVDGVTANAMLHLLRRVVLDLELAAKAGLIERYGAL